MAFIPSLWEMKLILFREIQGDQKKKPAQKHFFGLHLVFSITVLLYTSLSCVFRGHPPPVPLHFRLETAFIFPKQQRNGKGKKEDHIMHFSGVF